MKVSNNQLHCVVFLAPPVLSHPSPPPLPLPPTHPRHSKPAYRSTYRTGFLPPPDANVMLKLLEPLLDVEVQAWGGYEQVGHTPDSLL